MDELKKTMKDNKALVAAAMAVPAAWYLYKKLYVPGELLETERNGCADVGPAREAGRRGR